MKQFLGVFLLVVLGAIQINGRATNQINSRIISGDKAKLGQFPWQAALNLISLNGESQFCGGSLISPKWILTAAHCVHGVDYFIVTLGIVNLQDKTPGSIKLLSFNGFHHEDYNAFGNNDIALIELPEEVPLSDTIQLIRLPSRSEANNSLENIKVTISGWGKTSDASQVVSQDLNFIELETVSNKKCTESYDPESIISSTICAVGHPEHSPCNGDSGGPLIRIAEDGKPTQVGIASFVHDTGCASKNPSAYVRPGNYLDWIHKHTGIPIRD